MKYRLAIEVDGDTHSSVEERIYDEKRTLYLEKKGWTVIRFTNYEIYKQIDDVLIAITRHLSSTALAGEVGFSKKSLEGVFGG